MTPPAVRRALVAGAALAVGATGSVGFGPRPAGAQQVRLSAAKQLATAGITRRVLALRELTAAAKAMVRLSDTDRTALTNQLQDQVNGLTSLNAKIQGDGDEATVRADAGTVITDYRVYVLTIPKARGVVVSDVELIAEDRLSQLADRLQTMVNQASGRDTTKARADLAALHAKLALVTAEGSPLPASLLALQPAGYPGNRTTLEQARTTLKTGRQTLGDAATLARTVIIDLK